ncbi:Serine/threonine-protein kinase DCLK3 [Tetrabaena socialis]|uniref:Serine/threonine-protein kinase DCLK3 n=1 Tax=Tetrabaena socialis TaxID=47790 RepID=A0A2J7ZU23_9CHLO|nr:Serine/threonine-protein kinase DCLK3 [Tetrabaena socialis]|eukprot:PNH03771.1 Serine/threonine-protein kinase DCLK3 [Tetrabaena socialis]
MVLSFQMPATESGWLLYDESTALTATATEAGRLPSAAGRGSGSVAWRRLDVLLTADQPPANYWITVVAQYRAGSPAGYAVLHYAVPTVNGSTVNGSTAANISAAAFPTTPPPQPASIAPWGLAEEAKIVMDARLLAPSNRSELALYRQPGQMRHREGGKRLSAHCNTGNPRAAHQTSCSALQLTFVPRMTRMRSASSAAAIRAAPAPSSDAGDLPAGRACPTRALHGGRDAVLAELGFEPPGPGLGPGEQAEVGEGDLVREAELVLAAAGATLVAAAAAAEGGGVTGAWVSRASRAQCLNERPPGAAPKQGLLASDAREALALQQQELLAALQQDLSGLTGSWLKRVISLLDVVRVHTAANASLYGLIEGSAGREFVLLAEAVGPAPARVPPGAGAGPTPAQAALLCRMLETQRPVCEAAAEPQAADPPADPGALLLDCRCDSSDSRSTAGSPGPGAAAAPQLTSTIPLFEGSMVAPGGHGPSLVSGPGPDPAGPPPLLSSPAVLHQLGLTASVYGLGSDADTLRWLAGVLRRVAAARSMHALVWGLCEELCGHVRRRFILEAGVRAALLPGPDAPVGLLFHPQPPPPPPSPPQQQQQGGGSLHPLLAQQGSGGQHPQLAQQGGGSQHLQLGQQQRRTELGAASASSALRSGRSSIESGAAGAGTGAGAGGGVGAQGGGRVPAGLQLLVSVSSRHKMGVLATHSGAGSDCGSAIRTSKQTSNNTHLHSTASTSAQLRLLTFTGDASRGAAADAPSAPQSCSPLLTTRAIVVQLPPALAAAPDAPAAGLHAQAFPLKHTVLAALLPPTPTPQPQPQPAAPGSGSAAAAAAGLPPPPPSPHQHQPPPPPPWSYSLSQQGVVIEDVAAHLQDVHRPSRDVCLLLGAGGAGHGHGPGSGLGPGGGSRSPSVQAFGPCSAPGAASGHHQHPISAAVAAGVIGGVGWGAGGGGGGGGGSGGAPVALQSLVLVGLPLEEGAMLGLYVCFPRRLPGPLLAAVRDSCAELLGEVRPPAACCAMVCEWCDGGSLAAALTARTFPRIIAVPPPASPSRPPREHHPFQLDIKGVLMTLLDVAMALRHLHSMNLVHRDVKPANLLLKSSPRDHRGFTVKLADFGFVLHMTDVAEDGSRFISVDQACGTVTHMAPECLPGSIPAF